MPPAGRDRARIVCVSCHARKVRCDLQESFARPCNNCQRNNQQCIRRDSARKRLKLASSEAMRTLSPAQSSRPGDAASMMLETAASPARTSPASGTRMAVEINSRDPYPSPSTRAETGYIASHSVLLSQSPITPASSSVKPQSNHLQVSEAILNAAGATTLPKLPLRQALIDAYFAKLAHGYPVVDRKEVSGPQSSVLLLQAVCLAGSMARHDARQQSLALSQELYEKAKILTSLNYEPCSLTVLKAMCLLSIWSPYPSNSTSLDGPWHWSGCAIRSALQLGLHRQSTYGSSGDTGCRRRIWWHLFCSDRLQSACFGRPLMIQTDDFDVSPPTVLDFPEADTRAHVFVQCVHICAIIGDISELRRRGRLVCPEDVATLETSLRDWLCALPPELCLYHTDGSRRPYQRELVEIHLMYFVAVILLQAATQNYNRHWRASLASIVASSCVARLYEELYCREDVSFLLHIHSFYCMVAVVPQLFYQPQSAQKESCRQEELGILRSVVEQLLTRFGGAGTVLRNMDALAKDLEARGHHSSTANDLYFDEETLAEDRAKITELFPFPVDLCPNMDLLSATLTTRGEPPAEALLGSLVQDLPEWIFDENQPFLYAFGTEAPLA
ncbi:hypothetical protein GQ53DRAFT_849749 [Thozetella sp. PMI_491]|nr:hypothetical protein GQ53DRAFT_849749 [Thozetella sp. PMI_491]